MLASEREQFFYQQLTLGFDKAAVGYSAARAYGSMKCEMVLDGKHLTVCQKCATGEDEAFVQAMQDFRRQSDDKRAAEWQLRTVAKTPVLLFEPSRAHTQGKATSIMLHGPPAIEQPLSKRVLFVLSNERSGSSLLQLCLHAHSSLHAGQELYLLPFSTISERSSLLPFELKEVCLQCCASYPAAHSHRHLIWRTSLWW